jgi:RNA polymerase sigma factor (sigma-70 family)
MDWHEIYTRLTHDDDDVGAWASLEQRVRGWAGPEFARHGWHTVEDVVADTCSALALSLTRARGPETFAGFTFGCYLNARRRAFRARSEPSWNGLDGLLATVPQEDHVAEEDDLEHLHGALDRLPHRERQAVFLRYFEELSAAGIASRLGVTETNARRIVCNGLARLRREMLSVGGPSRWQRRSSRRPSARTSLDG